MPWRPSRPCPGRPPPWPAFSPARRSRHRPDPAAAPAVPLSGRPPPAVGRRGDRGRHGRPVCRHHAHHSRAGTPAPGPPHPSSHGRTLGRCANPVSHGRTPSRTGRHPQQPPAPSRLRHAPGRQPVRIDGAAAARGDQGRLPHGVTIGHLAHRSGHPPSPGRRTAVRATWPPPHAGIKMRWVRPTSTAAAGTSSLPARTSRR